MEEFQRDLATNCFLWKEVQDLHLCFSIILKLIFLLVHLSNLYFTEVPNTVDERNSVGIDASGNALVCLLKIYDLLKYICILKYLSFWSSI